MKSIYREKFKKSNFDKLLAIRLPGQTFMLCAIYSCKELRDVNLAIIVGNMSSTKYKSLEISVHVSTSCGT